MKNILIVTRSKSGDTEHYPELKGRDYDSLPQPILKFCQSLFVAPLENGIGLNEEDKLDKYTELYSMAVELEENEYYRYRLQATEPEKINESGLCEKDVEALKVCFQSENCKSWISNLRIKGNPPRLVEGECDYNVSLLMWNQLPFDKINFIYHSELVRSNDIVMNRMGLIRAICESLYLGQELPQTEEEKALLIIHDVEWGGYPNKTTYVLSEFKQYLELRNNAKQMKNPNDSYFDKFAKLTNDEIIEYSKYIDRIEIFKHSGAFWENINHFNFGFIDQYCEEIKKEQQSATLESLFN